MHGASGRGYGLIAGEVGGRQPDVLASTRREVLEYPPQLVL
jgi:hypothetical protein